MGITQLYFLLFAVVILRTWILSLIISKFRLTLSVIGRIRLLSKWSQHEVIRRVKDLPDENELAWFLICGKQDNLAFFPSHREFTDSLDFYGIGYDTSYFEGTHEFDTESWMKAIHWMDSIIDHSYKTLGISEYRQAFGNINVLSKSDE